MFGAHVINIKVIFHGSPRLFAKVDAALLSCIIKTMFQLNGWPERNHFLWSYKLSDCICAHWTCVVSAQRQIMGYEIRVVVK